MPKSRALQRQLGQYWTPEVLVDFMLDIAQFQPDWKVIDPACGEGVFLKRALERGAQQLVGIDIDPETLERATREPRALRRPRAPVPPRWAAAD
jgi:hypothetical protein